MDKKYTEKEILYTINRIFDMLDQNFKYQYGAKFSFDAIEKMVKDLGALFTMYGDINVKECGRLVITRYIKLLNLIITLDKEPERALTYHDELENAYKLAARVSLEHFIVYYEWYEEDKLYENREDILKAYVYYLNKMCFDETFTGIVANLPSGYRKMYRCKQQSIN